MGDRTPQGTESRLPSWPLWGSSSPGDIPLLSAPALSVGITQSGAKPCTPASRALHLGGSLWRHLLVTLRTRGLEWSLGFEYVLFPLPTLLPQPEQEPFLGEESGQDQILHKRRRPGAPAPGAGRAVGTRSGLSKKIAGGERRRKLGFPFCVAGEGNFSEVFRLCKRSGPFPSEQGCWFVLGSYSSSRAEA